MRNYKRGHMPWQMYNNTLTHHDPLGSAKFSSEIQLPPDHSFGLASEAIDAEHQVRPFSPKVIHPVRNFRKVNKLSVSQNFSQSKVSAASVLEGSTHTSGSKYYAIVLPDNKFVYGVKSLPKADFGRIIQHHYQRDEEELKKTTYQKLNNNKNYNKLSFYTTKSQLLQEKCTMARFRSEEDSESTWKLPRFLATKSKVFLDRPFAKLA